MSMQLTITYGSTTLDLQAGGYKLLDGFFPQAATDLESHVTEHFDLWLTGASNTVVEGLVRAINKAFEHARQHPTDADGVYLNFAINSTESTWRSRIYDGVAVVSAKMDPQMRRNTLKLMVSLERDPAWEGPEAQLALTNDNGEGNTSGLTVFGCNDGSGSAPNKKVNWVSIAGSAVAGDLPGSTRIELTNTSTPQARQIWIGQNWTNPTGITEIFEGEAGSGGETGTWADDSGGSYRTVTPIVGSESYLVNWDLTADQMSAWQGRWAHVMVRFSPGPNNQYTLQNTRFRFALEYGAYKLTDYGLVSHDTGFWMLDMGGVRLPPWLPGETSLAGVTMRLYALASVSGAIAVDYLAFLPADGYRYLTTPGMGVPQNSRIVDDGIKGETYMDNGSTAKLGIITPAGGDPIRLMPGLDQRLYFFTNDASNTANTASTFSVKVYYRPRRLTL